MQKKLFFFSLAIFLLAGLFSLVPKTIAYRVEQMKEVPIRNDFPIGPSQISIEAEPGDVIKKEIQIDNRAGEKREFKIEIEDFEGSENNPKETVMLQGSRPGKYGAKDWLSLEKYDFSINHGERQYLDVTIKIPETADVGDHYASVLVSMIPKDESDNKEGPNVRITSRAGILFFIKIGGTTVREGKLKSFDANDIFYWSFPSEKNKEGVYKNQIDFKTVFENTGTVRLRPSGQIEIKDMLGNVSGMIQIDEYNVLRNSLRQMEYAWNEPGFRMGKYTAKLKLNRGYDNLADSQEVSFWIIPLKQILIGLVSLIIFIIVLVFIRKKVDIKIKKGE
jgi:hypothetical protein